MCVYPDGINLSPRNSPRAQYNTSCRKAMNCYAHLFCLFPVKQEFFLFKHGILFFLSVVLLPPFHFITWKAWNRRWCFCDFNSLPKMCFSKGTKFSARRTPWQNVFLLLPLDVLFNDFPRNLNRVFRPRWRIP